MAKCTKSDDLRILRPTPLDEELIFFLFSQGLVVSHCAERVTYITYGPKRKKLTVLQETVFLNNFDESEYDMETGTAYYWPGYNLITSSGDVCRFRSFFQKYGDF